MTGEVYRITTNSSQLCALPCLTLSQFAANSGHYLKSNTTLVFLPGRHYLTVKLTVSGIDSFSMNSEILPTQIVCRNYSHFFFNCSQYIHITNMEFIGCGDTHIENAEDLVLRDTKFKGQEESGTALELIETTAQIVNSTFISNRKGKVKHNSRLLFNLQVGGAVIATHSRIDISQSMFEDNGADAGGAIYAEKQSVINTISTTFIGNHVTKEGGVLYSSYSNITIDSSVFDSNTANIGGGVVYSIHGSVVTIRTSLFNNNTNAATTNGGGGVLSSVHSTITIEASVFHNNRNTLKGGVLYPYYSTVTIETSEFDNNSATDRGGVLYCELSTITLGDSKFTNNNSTEGAAIYAKFRSVIKYNSFLLIANNSAVEHAIIYLSQSEYRGFFSGNAIFSSNLGSLNTFNSNITFNGYVAFVNNREPQAASSNFQEGGAITLTRNNIFFDGTCSLEHNHARNGGAVLSIESNLYVNGTVTIAHNIATRSGGGISLSSSELNCQQRSTLILFNNGATLKGGGLHAISSFIKLSLDTYRTRLNFNQNIAEKGGGLSMEANAKLFIQKYEVVLTFNGDIISFTANNADYGGAVYMDDDTISGTCDSNPKADCFFQVLVLHGLVNYVFKTHIMLNFSQNKAKISGSALYGGLLDRCALSQYAEVLYQETRQSKYEGNGITYFKEYSSTNISISSHPVKVCPCNGNEYNCTQEIYKYKVKKGETFIVSLVAASQIGDPVNGTIQTSLKHTESGVAEGQLTREIPAKCTNVTFNVVSPHSSEELTLYASDGPCKDAELSKWTIEIQFLSCSCLVGLQPSGKNNTNCTCECHRDISQYVEEPCDPHTGSFARQSQSKAWISYINDTNLSGYIVYSNCPFDYCSSLHLLIDLNQLNGADVQCAFNRSSLLCGSCHPDLNLSLGSSRCLSCPSYWPALLITITIAALLAGIALVALLLVLNMTVAVGTLNGLIFNANILYANRSILLPFQETNFITVLVSWLNLELGIDTCYFPGMDTFTKTWLQLAFPAYVIFLVVVVIIISSYSSRFSSLIGKKNPVATLATLILLSYAKLLEISFKTLSVGVLEYPDGSSEMVWLPDASVKYLSGKHIPLFIAALVVLVVGLVTLLSSSLGSGLFIFQGGESSSGQGTKSYKLS